MQRQQSASRNLTQLFLFTGLLRCRSHSEIGEPAVRFAGATSLERMSNNAPAAASASKPPDRRVTADQSVARQRLEQVNGPRAAAIASTSTNKLIAQRESMAWTEALEHMTNDTNSASAANDAEDSDADDDPWITELQPRENAAASSSGAAAATSSSTSVAAAAASTDQWSIAPIRQLTARLQEFDLPLREINATAAQFNVDPFVLMRR